MARNSREWARLTETYSLITQKRLAGHEGRQTLANRINGKALVLRNQFLPHYAGKPPKWRLWLRSFGGERTLPDFACVGALKSGTSGLSAYLFQHPCILPPLSKEINSWNTSDWFKYYPTVREKACVAREYGKALSGFFNTILHNVLIIDAYHAARPDAKIILILRNPVDRAYSHYKWELLWGAKRLAGTPYFRTFSDYVTNALDLFPTIPLPTRFGVQMLQAGIYVKAVELWIDRFGRENVYVLRAEDFFSDAASAVCGIHEFLEIPRIKPEIHRIINQNPIQPPPFEEETRHTLREFYRPWNEQLYALIGQDMQWE